MPNWTKALMNANSSGRSLMIAAERSVLLCYGNYRPPCQSIVTEKHEISVRAPESASLVDQDLSLRTWSPRLL